MDLGGEFGLDDLHGGDLAVAQVEGGGGGAVLAVSSADAAGEDLVLDVAPFAVPGAAAQCDGAAARALGDGLVGDERAHGLEHGLGHHQGGGHVRVHRGGVVGAHHGALAEAGFHHPGQALVDGQERVDEGDEAVVAAGADQGRADVGRASGLGAAFREVEQDAVARLLHGDADAHGLVEVDAVVVDAGLSLVSAVGPRGDDLPQPALGMSRQFLGGVHPPWLCRICPAVRPAASHPAGWRPLGRGCRPPPPPAFGCWHGSTIPARARAGPRP